MRAPVRSCHAAADTCNEEVFGSSPKAGLAGTLGFRVRRRPVGLRRTQNGHVSRSCDADRGLRRNALGAVEVGHDVGVGVERHCRRVVRLSGDLDDRRGAYPEPAAAAATGPKTCRRQFAQS
jgi:hypothetical protein